MFSVFCARAYLVQVRDPRGNTLLSLAAWHGHLEVRGLQGKRKPRGLRSFMLCVGGCTAGHGGGGGGGGYRW